MAAQKKAMFEAHTHVCGGNMCRSNVRSSGNAASCGIVGALSSAVAAVHAEVGSVVP